MRQLGVRVPHLLVYGIRYYSRFEQIFFGFSSERVKFGKQLIA